MSWFDKYVGKPWEAMPRPPESYNCGELVRAVHMDVFGIDTHKVFEASAEDKKEWVCAFARVRDGFKRLPDGERPREFDSVGFARGRFEDHCGIGVQTADGLLILHCLKTAGVVLESPIEALSRGFSRLAWYRHEGISALPRLDS